MLRWTKVVAPNETTWTRIKRSLVFQLQVCWPKPSRINLFQVFCFLFAAYYKKKKIKKMNRIGILKARCRCCFFLTKRKKFDDTFIRLFLSMPSSLWITIRQSDERTFFWIIAGKLSRPLGLTKSQEPSKVPRKVWIDLGGTLLRMAWLWISVWHR